jgi:hypothetical protein
MLRAEETKLEGVSTTSLYTSENCQNDQVHDLAHFTTIQR